MKTQLPKGSFLTFGNHKLPETTATINLCQAKNCPSRALGMCQLARFGDPKDLCYGLDMEKRCSSVRIRAERLEDFFDQLEIDYEDPTTAGIDLAAALWSHCRRSTDALRISVQGDFKNLFQLQTIEVAARTIRYVLDPAHRFVTYCYTARQDLWEQLKAHNPKAFVINGAGFMADNLYEVVHPLDFDDHEDGACLGSCDSCQFCLTATGRYISAPLRVRSLKHIARPGRIPHESR